jgi:hypothetical protein
MLSTQSVPSDTAGSPFPASDGCLCQACQRRSISCIPGPCNNCKHRNQHAGPPRTASGRTGESSSESESMFIINLVGILVTGAHREFQVLVCLQRTLQEVGGGTSGPCSESPGSRETSSKAKRGHFGCGQATWRSSRAFSFCYRWLTPGYTRLPARTVDGGGTARL